MKNLLWRLPLSAEWVLAGLILGAAVLRIIGLAAFPEVEADEGLWTNSSKNFVEFGDWFMDRRTHLFLSPAFHGISVAVFRLAGSSITHARVVSAVAGVLSVFLLYLLTFRVTGWRALALTTAAIFGSSEWTVLLSRRALIEPLQLFFLLAASVVLVRKRYWDVIAAAVLFGVGLSTKANAAFMVAVFGLFILLPTSHQEHWSARAAIVRAGVFMFISLAFATAVYGALYLAYPEGFVRAFRFELDGVHFEALSNPIVRFGRFGIDPVQAAHTIVGLVRESPFMMVCAMIGIAVAVVSPPRGLCFYAAWLFMGSSFLLGQMFQPIRYFYLVSPAYAFFAALTVCSLGIGGTKRVPVERRTCCAALAIYMAFNVAYLAMGAMANRGVKLREVVEWAASNTRATDRVMAAGYFCTDLPNRAYAHYHFAHDSQQLVDSIRQLEIAYVIYDAEEWHSGLHQILEERFEAVTRWPFGTAYRVTAPDQAASP